MRLWTIAADALGQGVVYTIAFFVLFPVASWILWYMLTGWIAFIHMLDRL